jgi:YHS domain-containing protein
MIETISKIEIEDMINDSNFNINEWFGYVYLTVHIPTNKLYIGKKQFFSSQNKKLGKKELAAIPVTRGRRPTKKKVITESNWKTYYGSSEEVKQLPHNELKRYLIRLCKTSKQLTYWETKCLFEYNVLEDDRFMNDNILGTFFRKDLLEAE